MRVEAVLMRVARAAGLLLLSASQAQAPSGCRSFSVVVRRCPSSVVVSAVVIGRQSPFCRPLLSSTGLKHYGYSQILSNMTR